MPTRAALQRRFLQPTPAKRRQEPLYRQQPSLLQTRLGRRLVEVMEARHRREEEQEEQEEQG